MIFFKPNKIGHHVKWSKICGPHIINAFISYHALTRLLTHERPSRKKKSIDGIEM